MTELKQENLWNKKEIREELNNIISLMGSLAETRELITEKVTTINGNTGIPKPLIRKVATAIYKETYDKLDEEDRIFKLLVDVFNGN